MIGPRATLARFITEVGDIAASARALAQTAFVAASRLSKKLSVPDRGAS